MLNRGSANGAESVIKKKKKIEFEEFKVKVPEYQNQIALNTLKNQLGNLKEMQTDLRQALEEERISKEEFEGNISFLDAQEMVLQNQVEQAREKLTQEIKRDLIRAKKNLGFVWVKKKIDEVQFWRVETGNTLLEEEERKRIVKFLNEQPGYPGEVKRCGVFLNSRELYILYSNPDFFTKVFALFNKNPGDVMNERMLEFSKNFIFSNTKLTNVPKIIQRGIDEVLFEQREK